MDYCPVQQKYTTRPSSLDLWFMHDMVRFFCQDIFASGAIIAGVIMLLLAGAGIKSGFSINSSPRSKSTKILPVT